MMIVLNVQYPRKNCFCHDNTDFSRSYIIFSCYWLILLLKFMTSKKHIKNTKFKTKLLWKRFKNRLQYMDKRRSKGFIERPGKDENPFRIYRVFFVSFNGRFMKICYNVLVYFSFQFCCSVEYSCMIGWLMGRNIILVSLNKYVKWKHPKSIFE